MHVAVSTSFDRVFARLCGRFIRSGTHGVTRRSRDLLRQMVTPSPKRLAAEVVSSAQNSSLKVVKETGKPLLEGWR